MFLIHSVKRILNRRKFAKQWRARNAHNKTIAREPFPMELVHVGNKTYGEIHVEIANKGSSLYIGNYCSIAKDVKFLLCVEHEIDRISTYPFKARCLEGVPEAGTKGDIVLEDDVWVGYHATILSGVRIGQGAVVAAGALVNKDVPPYAVVGGVPAKVLKYRFSPDMIEELLKVDYSQVDDDLLKANSAELYRKLESKEQLSWLPKKKA